MPRQVLLLLACTAAACQGAPREDESAQRKQAAEPEASGSERLNLVSASGWRPIHDVLAAGSTAASGEPRLPRTPSYAAPLSAAELARPKDLQRTSKRDLSAERKEQDRQRVDVVLPVGVGAPGARATRDPPPLPPRTAPWDRPRVAPISEPDNDVESVFGYRYPPPIFGPGPGLQAVAPGPSPTAPFWEAAWLRRRERLLQELGLPSLLPPPPCRCAPVDACLGYLPDGNPGRYRLEADPYRLGVGPYGLYGAWGRPLHSHNSAPLGAAQLHDNPN